MPTIRFGENTADDYNSVCEDTWMYDLAPDVNFDTSENFFCGTDGTGQIIRGLIRFNINSTLSSLGATNVYAADLKIYCEDEAAGADETITAYRCLLNWVTDEATWNDASVGIGNWNTAGAGAASDVTGEDSTADRRATGEDSVAITTVDTWYTLELDAAGEAWRAGTWSEYGVVIVNSDEGNNNTNKQFDSSEGTDGERPYFEVSYIGGIPVIMHHYTKNIGAN